MSNVLIGIVGVILFIGLALAVALFLGARFQNATNDSKAAAAVQAVSQVANAATLAGVQEGSSYSVDDGGSNSQVVALKDGGYLKSVPMNPLDSSNFFLAPRLSNASGARTGSATVVVMYVPSSGLDLCRSVLRQTGQVTDVPVQATVPTVTVGCFRAASGSETFVANAYYVFAAI